VDDSQVKQKSTEAANINSSNVTPSNLETIDFGKTLNAAKLRQKKEFDRVVSTEVELQKGKYNEVKTVPNN
jgi:hypothetical protein